MFRFFYLLMICLVSVVSLFVSALSCLVSFRFLFYNHPVSTGKIELNKFHASKKAPFYLVILPVKSILSDGIPQAFLPFRFGHHSSWPFLECRRSKLYFKILWKYDDWSFRFHHFLENGRYYRENTYKCSPLVTKWQIIWHFHCCFNNKYIPYFLG